jgi:ferredoxin
MRPGNGRARAPAALDPKIRREEGTVAMKIVIDYDLCEANAVCMDVCPECFRVEEDDTLTVLVESPPENLRAKVEEAVRLCPRQAISLAQD